MANDPFKCRICGERKEHEECSDLDVALCKDCGPQRLTDTLIIKIDPNSEEGFNVDVYHSEQALEDCDPLDGGIYTGEDMTGALKMAVGLAKDLIKRDKVDEPT